MDGYTKAPNFAWAGWRLRVPGGPVGGQYHGYLAGIQPEEFWGGIPLAEGETLSDHVYRSPGEVRPRANASGGANVIHSYQTLRTPGYAEAPGNYKELGGLGIMATDGERLPGRTYAPGTPAPGASIAPRYPIRQANGDAVVRQPFDPRLCPTWGCGPVPPQWYLRPGPTSTVTQPPPPTTPVVSNSVTDPTCSRAGYYRDAAGNCTNDWHNPYSLYLPQTGPSPTVAASPSDYLPSQGQTVPGITPAATGSFSDWLSSSTIINGVANQWVLAGGGLLAFLLLKGKR
jgi:hypothetical protein